MLLSKRKIETIHQLFKVPYKPTLTNLFSQKDEIATKSIQLKNSTLNSRRINQPQSKYNNTTIEPIKSNYPVYTQNINTDLPNSYNNNMYSSQTISYDNNYNNYQYNYFPHRREIIIKNPEEIIQSGILKGPTRVNDENQDANPNMNKEGFYQGLNDNIQAPPMQPIFNNVQSQVQNIPPSPKSQVEHNLEEPQEIISQKEENEIDKVIPGNLAETKIINEEVKNPPEEEAPVVNTETPPLKKYVFSNCNGNIVKLPENYSTDDEDEYTAVNTLNEDLSNNWKKYTDKDGIKLYFKAYPVKDEDGKDAQSVIGYCEAILDFPASKVIEKMNTFTFRQNTDDQYKKGKLLSERVEGNIKYMEMYLYMKMPFIFSDRDFVVLKKCWLDYNGNKDHALFYIHSTENSQYPKKSKPVRGEYKNRSGYIKPLSDNQCQINVITAMDIKMSLGVERMSSNGAEMQEKWIKSLRKELAK